MNWTPSNAEPPGKRARCVAVVEPMPGSGDIQSLADLGNSFEILRGMRIIPVSKEAVFQLGVATLAPIVPLVLTMMALDDLLKKMLGIIF